MQILIQRYLYRTVSNCRVYILAEFEPRTYPEVRSKHVWIRLSHVENDINNCYQYIGYISTLKNSLTVIHHRLDIKHNNLTRFLTLIML